MGIRWQKKLRTKQNNPAVPILIAPKIVSLSRPQCEQSPWFTGNRLEIDPLRASAMGDAYKHMAFIPVGHAHLFFTGSPLKVGHAKDLQIIWVGHCRSVAEAFDIFLLFGRAHHYGILRCSKAGRDDLIVRNISVMVHVLPFIVINNDL